jgi:chorismate mutase
MTALELLNNYPDWEGAKVLQLLINHPNTDIYASVLELCLESSVPPLEAQNLRYHLAPIKMTDEKTLKAIDESLNQLIAQKTEITTQLSSTPEHQNTHTQALSPCATMPAKRFHPSTLSPFHLRNTPTPQSSTTIDSEIAALIAYRKECTLPTGSIKCFNDEDTKAFRRQAQAIRRLLAQATKDGHHEAVAIVKANLKKGKIMRWEE